MGHNCLAWTHAELIEPIPSMAIIVRRQFVEQDLANKLCDISLAVSRHVKRGHCIFLGGFGQCIPFALGMELARQNKRELTLCRSGADILFDMLIAAGAVKKVIFGYLGNPGVGLAHEFRRRCQAGQIEVEDWTNFSMILRLHASALGVPFLPAATLLAGDTPGASANVRQIDCPFTGERLAAIPALTPDVAFVHAQRADCDGNVQLFGLPGDTLEGANAARKIIVSVEEIVASGEIRLQPDRTILPGFRVAAVCQAPFGAYPSYVQGHYGRDDDFYIEYDRLARDAEALRDFVGSALDEFGSWEDFVRSNGVPFLEKLKAQASPSNADISPLGKVE